MERKINCQLFNDHYENARRYQIPRAQLIIADIPYNLGNNAYASDPRMKFLDLFAGREDNRKELCRMKQRNIVLSIAVILIAVVNIIQTSQIKELKQRLDEQRQEFVDRDKTKKLKEKSNDSKI